jgi:hypothetical protein
MPFWTVGVGEIAGVLSRRDGLSPRYYFTGHPLRAACLPAESERSRQ